LTGIERNQCRKRRIQRNHIACAILVWVRLAELARKTKQTMYRLKQGLLDDYLIDQLKNPTILMRLA
jgi:macrodomain Ter protein organizer (MatP/YcbG family)